MSEQCPKCGSPKRVMNDPSGRPWISCAECGEALTSPRTMWELFAQLATTQAELAEAHSELRVIRWALANQCGNDGCLVDAEIETARKQIAVEDANACADNFLATVEQAKQAAEIAEDGKGASDEQDD